MVCITALRCNDLLRCITPEPIHFQSHTACKSVANVLQLLAKLRFAVIFVRPLETLYAGSKKGCD